MKAFTAILMICLPVAAMGETYVCRTESSSILSSGTRGVLTSTDVDLTDYVVDMESGFRALADTSNYRGECQAQERSLTIACSYSDPLSAMQIYIDLGDLAFTYSSHVYGDSVRTSFGTCIEL